MFGPPPERYELGATSTVEPLGPRRSQRLRRESDEARVYSLLVRHEGKAACGQAAQRAKRAENQRRFAERGAPGALRGVLRACDEARETVEELARTNDELQSANREFERLNEELRAANERLASVVEDARTRTMPARGASAGRLRPDETRPRY